MRCHLPVFIPFGITLNRLTWQSGSEESSSFVKGPSMRPNEHSFSRYCYITSGCSCADCRLRAADFSGDRRSNPTLKPSLIPLSM